MSLDLSDRLLLFRSPLFCFENKPKMLKRDFIDCLFDRIDSFCSHRSFFIPNLTFPPCSASRAFFDSSAGRGARPIVWVPFLPRPGIKTDMLFHIRFIFLSRL